MVSSAVLDAYGIDVDTCSSLRVVLAGGNTLYIRGWLLPQIKPILGRVLVAYYSGLDFDFVGDELNKVADEVFK